MESTCERLMQQLKYIAARIAGHDTGLLDDLVQEMAIAILEAEPGHLNAYYLQKAEWRALNYAEKFRRFPRTGLDENR